MMDSRSVDQLEIFGEIYDIPETWERQDSYKMIAGPVK